MQRPSSTEQATVIATDVDDGKLEGLKARQRLALDVLSAKAVDALAGAVAREFGGLDVLVNVAGYVHHGSVLDATEQDLDFSFDLNVKSMHRTMQAFIPGMLKKGGGSIINMSSAASSIRGRAEPLRLQPHQGRRDRADKSDRDGFHQAGRPRQCDLPRHDRIAVVPRPRRGARRALRDSAAGRGTDFIDRQPMGRIGTAEEVAMLAVYLASDESAFISGHTHLIDGGWAL